MLNITVPQQCGDQTASFVITIKRDIAVIVLACTSRVHLRGHRFYSDIDYTRRLSVTRSATDTALLPRQPCGRAHQCISLTRLYRGHIHRSGTHLERSDQSATLECGHATALSNYKKTGS